MNMPARTLAPRVTLDKLLQGIAAAPAIEICGIRSDSRKLKPGDLFLACQGATAHGLDFLEQAKAAGVVAVAWDPATRSAVEADLPLIAVPGLAAHIGEIANRWFDRPSSTVRVSGVTGTNGKTTVAYLIAQCLSGLGNKCGYIGTLGSGIGAISNGCAMTTPACIDLHELLAGFREQSAQHAAIEVSSHALEQSRVDGVRFDAAIFTNLTRDHIDYHGSMQAYFESKARLFLDYEVRKRIVSIDSDYGVELVERCGTDVVAVSARLDRVATNRPHVFIRALARNPSGSTVSVVSSWGSAELTLRLPGDFNVANALQVLALLLCNDIPLADACAALAAVSAPPGRMELVNPSTNDALPAVYVDYSHTPASLEAALQALRAHCDGKLWCVFGCGGDRDRGKRAMMGGVAERLADVTIVTSDNPRSEAPESIIADVLEGMSGKPEAIVDRGEAIAQAVRQAGQDDIVLIAGKGHENYQVIGGQTLAFSDRQSALAALLARSTGSR